MTRSIPNAKGEASYCWLWQAAPAPAPSVTLRAASAMLHVSPALAEREVIRQTVVEEEEEDYDDESDYSESTNRRVITSSSVKSSSKSKSSSSSSQPSSSSSSSQPSSSSSSSSTVIISQSGSSETIVPSIPATEYTQDARCLLPLDQGPCRTYIIKWYYDKQANSCAQFWYGGCSGNGNRFDTEDECKKTCVSTTEGEF